MAIFEIYTITILVLSVGCIFSCYLRQQYLVSRSNASFPKKKNSFSHKQVWQLNDKNQTTSEYLSDRTRRNFGEALSQDVIEKEILPHLQLLDLICLRHTSSFWLKFLPNTSDIWERELQRGAGNLCFSTIKKNHPDRLLLSQILQHAPTAVAASHLLQKGEMWIVMDGGVYDVAPFLHDHPGGPDVLLELVGQDASSDFELIGHSRDAGTLRKTYYVGPLF